MRLLIDQTLFAPQSQADAMGLLDLLSTVARDPRVHSVLTDPPYLLGSGNGPMEAWLACRSSWEADVIRALLTNGPILDRVSPFAAHMSDARQPRRWNVAGSLKIRVERRAVSDWQGRRLTVTDASDLLREPVHLVLENEWTDLAFLRLLAGSTHGSALAALTEEAGRISLHGGGGGAGKKWLDSLAGANASPATWRRLLRTWVLFDKDAGDPDVRGLSGSALALLDLCEKVAFTHGEGLSWICLLRREIESYAPDRGLLAESLQSQKAFASQVISWRTTQPDWAWSLDLKKGLRGDTRTNLSEPERQDLKARKIPLEPHMLKPPFSGLPRADVSAMEGGLGERLGRAFLASPPPAWTADLPAEYDRGPADQVPRLSLVQSLFDRM